MNRPTYMMRRFLAVRPNRTIRCFTTTSRQLTSEREQYILDLLNQIRDTSPDADEVKSFADWQHRFGDNEPGMWEKEEKPAKADQPMEAEVDAAKNVDPFAVFDEPDDSKYGDWKPSLPPTVTRPNRRTRRQLYQRPPPDSEPILSECEDKEGPGQVEKAGQVPAVRYPTPIPEEVLKTGKVGFRVRYSRPFPSSHVYNKSDLSLPRRRSMHISFSPACSSTQPTEQSSSRSSSVPSASLPSARQRANLPLSPLMAPNQSFWSTLHEPKAPPPENPTPFQQRLMKNPYAHALSSPVRMCALTRTWLPRSFLQSFELLPRRDTDELWYLPRDLTAPVPRDQLSPGETNKQVLVGKRHYVLTRKELLEAVNVRNSGFTGQWQKFLDQQQRALNDFSITRIKWRDDMDSVVLGLMRKRTVEELVALAGKNAGYLSYATDWEYVAKKKQMGAVLWLGKYTKKPRTKFPDWWVDKEKDNSFAKNSQGEREAQDDVPIQSLIDENGPGFFATLSNPPLRSKQLQVHNLIELLGQEGVNSLRAQTPGITNYEFVGVKDKKDTLKVQLMLWKLQGFLAKANDIEQYQ